MFLKLKKIKVKKLFKDSTFAIVKQNVSST